MRLFHVSEDPNIKDFIPRIPYRQDLDQSQGLVWALNERCLPNFLTPRDCPRVAYHVGINTRADDIDIFFSSGARHVVAIEHGWFSIIASAKLYLYEFDPINFHLQDDTAGYYISHHTERPIDIIEIRDLFGALFERDVEVRILNRLWDLRDKVLVSSLNWSFCRMGNARPR